jgi:hypothetical protein
MSIARTTKETLPSREEWQKIVLEQVKKLRFGVVQITIHEGRVTQVDATERTRLANKGALGG